MSAFRPEASDSPPWGNAVLWAEANDTLAHLIREHRSELAHVEMLAREIEKHLFSIFPLMDELCATSCPHCPDPCCLNARVWADFRDLLFLHIGGHRKPPRQLIGNRKESCRYLGFKGCVLPRVSRPWVCTWYLCPPQTAIFRRKDAAVRKAFDEAVRDIKTKRKEMESEFLRLQWKT